MKRKFPEVLLQRNQIQRYEVYKAGIFSCDEAGVEMQFVAGKMANLVQQLEGFVVLLCPVYHRTTRCFHATLGRSHQEVIVRHQYGKRGGSLKNSRTEK
ncbi:hypothetical protein RvY_15805-3 [Ramazzottius varieornatus]|uniref:Uncharacterized protein n=1 Tax=Ramazzottius varieornatus TaxID=947166 RepID=A0A1D1VW76_RAMVA|nr:hypothetical protein RvY_15805-3 [Ramazzottius varieornatus]